MILGGLAASILLTGCINLEPVEDPTRTYILSSADLSPIRLSREGETISLFIERVEIPPYLDDRRLVTRVAPNEVEFHEFYRWAEPIAEGIGRTIAENLDSMEVVKDVGYHPWRKYGRNDYRIRLKIFHFEANETGDVEFSGIAEIYEPGDALVMVTTRDFRFRSPVIGQGMDGVVAAMSDSLAQFSTKLAEAYRERSLDDEPN